MRPVLSRVCLSLTAVVLALPAAGQKTPDTRITPAPVVPRTDLEIAAVGRTVYAVWTDGRNGETDIYFSRSLDDGATWLAHVRLDNDPRGAASSRVPAIAVAGSAVYVVWADARNGSGDIYFQRSQDGGASWLAADMRVDTDPIGAAHSGNPQIAAVGTSLCVVWEDTRGPSGGIYCNRSLDGGMTWLAADVRLSGTLSPGGGEYPQLVMEGSAVYVTWRHTRYAIDFNRSLDSGTTWLASEVRLNAPLTGRDYAGWPRIAAVGSKVFVTWQDDRVVNGAPDIYLNQSVDGGASWLPAELRLNTDAPGAAKSESPEIAALGASVYVVWEDGRNGADDVYLNRSSDGGNAWLASDLRVSTSAAGAFYARDPVVAASETALIVAWNEGRSGLTDIFCNRSLDGGVTWLASDLRLDTDPAGAARSYRSEIAMSGAAAYVAWEDDRNGLYDLYCNIPWGLQPYGAGTVGTQGIAPQLTGNGIAFPGHTVSLTVSGGLGSAPCGMLLGGPGSKASLPLLGGTLLVVPTAVLPLMVGGTAGVPGAGFGSRELDLPHMPSLLGTNLNFQAVLMDAGARMGLSMTNAVELWIG